MNAIIRNECERELLAIFKEVIAALEIEIDIESEAFKEGGLKEIWKFIGSNAAQLTFVLAVLTIIISRIPVENKDLVQLQMENLRLDNELKKQELLKNKKELSSSKEVTPELVEKVVETLNRDYKIVWHKSNYYKKLNLYPKITKISTQQLNENNIPIGDEQTVLRPDFQHFIIRTNDVLPEIDEDAVIDIISPVLKKGRFRWRGIYNNEIISFEMSDKAFVTSVLNKEIEFINGTAIKCVLKQHRKIDDTGIVKITYNQVTTVFEVITNELSIPTEQGKKFKKEKKGKDDQFGIGF